MKKTLKYISVPVAAAIIALISMMIPYAQAQDFGAVQGRLTVEETGCIWTGTPGLSTSSLSVPDGHTCIISTDGWAASTVTVDADVIYGGGTLIVGSNANNVTFTVHGNITIQGNLEVGRTGNPSYDTVLATVSGGDLLINTTGNAEILANSAGSNSVNIVDPIIIGTGGLFALNDDSTSYAAYVSVTGSGTLDNNAGTLSMSGASCFDANNTAAVTNGGTLTVSNACFMIRGTSTLTNSGTINVSSNSLILSGAASTLTNSGTINVSSNSLILGGAVGEAPILTNTGKINVHNAPSYNASNVITVSYNSILTNDGGEIEVFNYLTMRHDAVLNNNSNGIIKILGSAGSIYGNLNLQDTSELNNNSGTISGNALNVYREDMINRAVINNFSQINFYSMLNMRGNINNYNGAYFLLSAASYIQSGGKITNESGATFEIRKILRITGYDATADGTSVFANFGSFINRYGSSGGTEINEYGFLNLQNGVGPDDSVADLLYLYVIKDTGKVNIETNARLLTLTIRLGQIGSSDCGKIFNAGYIGGMGSKTDPGWWTLNITCYGGAVENLNEGLIYTRDGYVVFNGDAAFTNNNGAELRARNVYHVTNYINLNNTSTFTNNGTWSAYNLNVYNDSSVTNSGAGAELTIYVNLTGDGTGVSIITSAPLTITNKLSILNGAEIAYNDHSGHTYSAKSIEMQSYDSVAEAAKITVASGVTLNVTGTHAGCAGTNTCSLEIGTDNPGATPGTSELIINGTLSIPDTASNGRIEIGNLGRGTVVVAEGGLLDVDETNAVFYIRGDSSETASAQIDGTMDIEMPLYVSGTMQVDSSGVSNAGVNMVSSYTVTSTGQVTQGLSSTVTVEGSTTEISGDYQLDGLLDTGTDDGDSLTVTSTGHISSGGGTSTNFKILAHDLTIQSGGIINADGVSEVDPGSQGSGSYGGAGQGRSASSTYGKTKLDIDDTPLFGQAGAFNSSGSLDALGGGGIRIYANGTVSHNGQISANGDGSVNSGGGAGAGGTVILIHEPLSKNDTFTGSGSITANGGNSATAGAPVGGGGRLVIHSILYDDPDAASYGLSGTVSALPGVNSSDPLYAAAGTIVYTGDGHNALGTLIVDQNNTYVSGTPATEIPNTGTPADFTFARVEARNGAKIAYAAAPSSDPVSCFEVGTDSIVDETHITCTPNPDKPDTLYVNNSWDGAQSGDEPANGSPISGLYDLTPAFSVIYRNPEDTTTPVRYVNIQVDNDSDFSSPLWNTTIDLGADNTVVDGERTRGIDYDEDSMATGPLTTGTTYYVRMAFRDSTNTVTGLWTHRDIGDANGDYHYNFDIDGSMIIDENCFFAGTLSIKDPTGGGNVRNAPGDRYGNGYCEIMITSTVAGWQVLFGKQPGESLFEDATKNDDIDPIDNTGGGTACEMDTTGNTAEEKYGYNINTSGSTNNIKNYVNSHSVCSRKYDNSDQGGGNEYMFTVPGESSEDSIIANNDNPITADSFRLYMHANVDSLTAVTSYFLGIRAIITTSP